MKIKRLFGKSIITASCISFDSNDKNNLYYKTSNNSEWAKLRIMEVNEITD